MCNFSSCSQSDLLCGRADTEGDSASEDDVEMVKSPPAKKVTRYVQVVRSCVLHWYEEY